ncbi:MAG: lamin tail domain-containing protein [Flavobacteriales bacterium]|nr:lamin tail domain-containing protein [Flavobacteriales bacterium]
MEQATAEEENNYCIIPFNSAAAVVLDGVDPALVHLTLAIAMQNGNTYSITVNGVEDLAGNAVRERSNGCDLFIPEVAARRSAQQRHHGGPSPVVGLPDAEFVEIHNTTADKTFDLAGWTYSDGGQPAHCLIILPPGGFAILTDDAANAVRVRGFGTVAPLTSLPSINNDGDPPAIE